MHPQQSPPAAVAVMQPSSTRRRLRFMVLSLLMLALATVASVSLSSTVAAQSAEAEPADVAESIQESVVTVYTYARGGTFSPGQTGRAPTGAGSGWVWTDDGLVITNAHVVADAEEISVVTTDGAIIPASVVGSDWYQDVAVLQLEPKDGQELPPPLPVGDVSEVRTGDKVIAIGTPHGQFANTVRVGQVLGTGQRLDTGEGYSLLNLILHDATLAPGNSGGPLVSMEGEVIGVNVASRRRDGGDYVVGFAIDANAAVAVATDIVQQGAVNRPWLGVTSDITPQGQVVAEVDGGSPAAVAGLEPGDLIVAVDAEEIDVTHPFIDLLYRHEPGDTITLTVVRDAAELELEVQLGTRPEVL